MLLYGVDQIEDGGGDFGEVADFDIALGRVAAAAVVFGQDVDAFGVDPYILCRHDVGHLLYVVFTGMHAYAAVQAAELAAYLLYLLLPLLAGVFHPAVEVLGVGNDGRTDAAADLALAAAAAVLAGQQSDEGGRGYLKIFR